MKKFISMVLVVAMLLVTVCTASAADKVTVIVNGQKVNGECITKNGRTLAPVRAIAEALGAEVFWNEKEQKVTIEKIMNSKIRNVYMWIGRKELSIDNMFLISLDEPAQTVNGRTVIPVKALCDALEVNVSWNDKTQTVTISSAPTTIENAVNTDNVISSNLKKAEDEAVALLEKQEAEARASGIVSAYGYRLMNVSAADYVDAPYVFVKLENSLDGKHEACNMKLNIRNKVDNSIVLEVPFTVGEIGQWGSKEIFLRDIPSQYIDNTKYSYDVRVVN